MSLMTFSSLNLWLSCHVSSLMHNHYDGWIYFVTVRSSLTTVSVLRLLCRIHVLMCAHCVYDFFMPHSWTFFVLVVVCLVSICRCGLLCGLFFVFLFAAIAALRSSCCVLLLFLILTWRFTAKPHTYLHYVSHFCLITIWVTERVCSQGLWLDLCLNLSSTPLFSST